MNLSAAGQNAPGVRDVPSVLSQILVRMADEGMPVRAIARSIHLPSEDVRLIIRAAIDAGDILIAPRDDWPPEVARADRLPGFPSLADHSTEDMIFHLVHCLEITKLQATVLLQLLKRREANRDQLHAAIEARRDPNEKRTDRKIVDVVVCILRKRLKPLGIFIRTVRDCGYMMSLDHRRKTTVLLNKHLGIPTENALAA